MFLVPVNLFSSKDGNNLSVHLSFKELLELSSLKAATNIELQEIEFDFLLHSILRARKAFNKYYYQMYKFHSN